RRAPEIPTRLSGPYACRAASRIEIFVMTDFIQQDLLEAEYADHARLHPPAVLEAALADMQARAAWSDMSWDSAPAAVARIRSAIDEGRPFSMVRVGDGTGNLLGYRDPRFSRLRDHALRQILTMTFGTADFSEAEIDRIRAGLIRAIRSADVLGVSDLFRLGRLRAIEAEPEKHRDKRGH